MFKTSSHCASFHSLWTDFKGVKREKANVSNLFVAGIWKKENMRSNFFPCSEGIKGLLLFPPKDPSVACFGLARLLGPFGRHRLDFSESCHCHSMKESSMSWLKNLVPLEDIRDFCHLSSYVSFPWALKYSFFVQFFWWIHQHSEAIKGTRFWSKTVVAAGFKPMTPFFTSSRGGTWRAMVMK